MSATTLMVWLVFVLGGMAVIFLSGIMEKRRLKESGYSVWVGIVVIIFVIFGVIQFKLLQKLESSGSPTTIDQLRKNMVYYVNELIPKLDLMLVSRSDEFPTKNLWVVKGIPDTITKDCRFITKKVEKLELDGKARKVTEVINLY